jgi:hypothetical protein
LTFPCVIFSIKSRAGELALAVLSLPLYTVLIILTSPEVCPLRIVLMIFTSPDYYLFSGVKIYSSDFTVGDFLSADFISLLLVDKILFLDSLISLLVSSA